MNAGADGFFKTGSRQPGPTYVSVHCGFFFGGGGGGGGILRVRGFTGLMKTIIHKQSCEEFVNVFNSSILY